MQEFIQHLNTSSYSIYLSCIFLADTSTKNLLLKIDTSIEITADKGDIKFLISQLVNYTHICLELAKRIM